MKRIALETFYGATIKEASGRPPPSAEPLSIQLHIWKLRNVHMDILIGQGC